MSANTDAPHSDPTGDADAAIRQLDSDQAEALFSYARRFCLGADAGPKPPWVEGRAARRLIAVLLLAAAALDLARCYLVTATAQRPAPAAGLVAGGLAAAALSIWTARGHLRGRRWPAWAAVLIGAASAPQAAASGFGAPYTFPDTATAVLGVLLAVAVLASVGHTTPGLHTENPCAIDKEAP